MNPYFGNHSSKQFIRGKPIRFGFKIWAACFPNGYVAQMEPYQGAGGKIPIDRGIGLGGSVIKYLVFTIKQRYPAINFNVYGDRFFSR